MKQFLKELFCSHFFTRKCESGVSVDASMAGPYIIDWKCTKCGKEKSEIIC